MVFTDVKQNKAKAGAHGQTKTEKLQILATKDAAEMMDSRAAQLKVSRSEYIERVVRWVDEHWDGQLERDLGWEDKEDD